MPQNHLARLKAPRGDPGNDFFFDNLKRRPTAEAFMFAKRFAAKEELSAP